MSECLWRIASCRQIVHFTILLCDLAVLFIHLVATLAPLLGPGGESQLGSPSYCSAAFDIQIDKDVVRRECPDRTLFWTVTDLETKLLDFKDYYNSHRTHVAWQVQVSPVLTSSCSSRALRKLQTYIYKDTSASGTLRHIRNCHTQVLGSLPAKVRRSDSPPRPELFLLEDRAGCASPKSRLFRKQLIFSDEADTLRPHVERKPFPFSDDPFDPWRL